MLEREATTKIAERGWRYITFKCVESFITQDISGFNEYLNWK